VSGYLRTHNWYFVNESFGFLASDLHLEKPLSLLFIVVLNLRSLLCVIFNVELFYLLKTLFIKLLNQFNVKVILFIWRL
jgi:hypothetical protein